MSRMWNIRSQLQNIYVTIHDLLESIQFLLRSSMYTDKHQLRMTIRNIKEADLTEELSKANNTIQTMEEYKKLL